MWTETYLNISDFDQSNKRRPHVPPQKAISFPKSTGRKLLIFPSIIATTFVSLVLLVSLKRDWTIHDDYYDRIVNNRATTQLIVQILAGLLGVGQISAVRGAINFWARQRLSRRPVSLDALSFYTSLSTANVNWSLPTSSLSAILATMVIASVPSALWAGALTPIDGTAKLVTSGFVPVAVYSNISEHLWKNQSWFSSGSDYAVFKQTPSGMYSYGPHRDRFSFFINSGSTASSLNGTAPRNKKGDNSNYNYIGRSYGAGASVGVLDASLTVSNRHLRRYSYFETTYNTQWSCSYNFSMATSLKKRSDKVWFAANPEESGGYNLADLGTIGPPQIVGSSSWHKAKWNDEECRKQNTTEPNLHLSLVTTDEYKELNATQCQALLTPTDFLVDVNVVDGSILVIPQNATNVVKELDCFGLTSWRAADTLSALAMISTTSYTSAIGNMLRNNIFSVKQQKTSETDERKTLRGIEESLQALADQFLFSSAGAQLVIANDTIAAPVVGEIDALRIGQGVYIWAIFVVNTMVLLAICFEAVRTRLWYGLPKLNFADVKTAIVVSSYGGRSIANRVSEKYPGGDRVWDGDADEKFTGGIKVRLRDSSEGIALEASE